MPTSAPGNSRLLQRLQRLHLPRLARLLHLTNLTHLTRLLQVLGWRSLQLPRGVALLDQPRSHAWPGPAPRSVHQSGFTLIELLIVLAIIAVGAALVSLALPDGDAARLEEEGARLSALLEMARAEARVSGAAVSWVPRAPAEGLTDLKGEPVHFRFVGLPAALALPSRWLDARVEAQIVGASALTLGPSAILPPQRVVLSLASQRLELVSDGLGPFAVATTPLPLPADAAPR